MLPAKKQILVLAIKTTLVTLCLLLGYYFLILKPQLALPTALLNAQKTLTLHHTNLLQNRLALTELTRLHPNSSALSQEKRRLIQTLKTTNEQGLKAVIEHNSLPEIKGAPSPPLTFLNTQLGQAFPDLLEQTRQVFNKQQNLITNLDNLDTETANLFSYSPQQDLDQLELSADKKSAITRANAAIQGLDKIAQDLNQLDLDLPEIQTLQTKMLTTQQTLEDFITQLQEENFAAAAETKNQILLHFAQLKRQALDAQIGLIKSTISINLLTAQTNLILQYDFWLQQISENQAQLNPSY